MNLPRTANAVINAGGKGVARLRPALDDMEREGR